MNSPSLNRGYCLKIIIFVSVLSYSSVLAGENGIEDDKVINQKYEKMNLYQSCIDRGNSYSAKNEIDKAIEEYKKAVDLNPMNPTGYYLRGNSFRKNRDYGKAMKDYDTVLALKPESFIAYWTYLGRGMIYANKGKQEESIEEYEKAIRINPKDPSAYHLRGKSYHMMGQYEEAIKDLRKTIALGSENPYTYTTLSRIHYDYGNFFKRKGHYDRAIEEYSAAIVLTPKAPQLYAGRGYSYILKGDKQNAMVDLQKACDLGNQNSCRILEVLKSK